MPLLFTNTSKKIRGFHYEALIIKITIIRVKASRVARCVGHKYPNNGFSYYSKHTVDGLCRKAKYMPSKSFGTFMYARFKTQTISNQAKPGHEVTKLYVLN